MPTNLRASSECPAEIIGDLGLAPDAGSQPQPPAPVIPQCCERWPMCSCLRESKILSLSNSRLGRVFENPEPWDSVTLPGVSYGVMHVFPDGTMAVAAAWEGPPPDADYLTRDIDWWQEQCLRSDATLHDGEASRRLGRPMASGGDVG